MIGSNSWSVKDLELQATITATCPLAPRHFLQEGAAAGGGGILLI